MPVPARILVLFAHPAFQKSRVHRHLVAAARAVEGVTVHDLYEAYPSFQIDVAHEQRLLLEHDVVVFQHPFYWYSGPALLKEWMDLVLDYNFAYGPEGTRLQGKALLSAITAGGSAHAYARDGHNRYTMEELLRPFEQTAVLCGMAWLPPFVVHGTARLTGSETIAAHAAAYAARLKALRAG